ncbi:MAG: hypothetical protein Q7K42_03470 [Candidatus Diapherotrites archaeon]|nr:hypothetical protein [Candidatus Diapherotrites archaeon]
MWKKLGMTEKPVLRHELDEFERKLYDFICQNWPTYTLEIAEHFGEPIKTREEKKRASAKFTYYLKKLIEKHLIFVKKSGHGLIVWPVLVEKYRVIHDILSPSRPAGTSEIFNPTTLEGEQ